MKGINLFIYRICADIDEKYMERVMNDDAPWKPRTIISINALGKVRKLGIDAVDHYIRHMLTYAFFEILGKIAYFFTKKVVLSDNYQKYWVNKGSYSPDKDN
jgi:hypothetical protein